MSIPTASPQIPLRDHHRLIISGNISIKDLIQIKDQPKRKLDQVIEVKDEKILSKKQKLWIPDSELTTTDRSIIENGEWLNDKHINFAQIMLKHLYSHISGLQNPILAQHRSFSRVKDNMVQILHCGGINIG